MAEYIKEASNGNLYPESPEKRKTDKYPHFRGPVYLTAAQGKLLVEHFKAGADQVEMRLAGWKNSGDRGSYIGLTLEVNKIRSEQLEKHGGEFVERREVNTQQVDLTKDFEDDIPF